jgi:hypothetical protein
MLYEGRLAEQSIQLTGNALAQRDDSRWNQDCTDKPTNRAFIHEITPFLKKLSVAYSAQRVHL